MSSKIVKTLRPCQKTPLKPLILLCFWVLKELKTSLRPLRLFTKKECIHHVRTLKYSIQFSLYQGFLVCSQHTLDRPHTHIDCPPLPCICRNINVARAYQGKRHPCKDMLEPHIRNIHFHKLSFNHSPFPICIPTRFLRSLQ